jgi:hypothetical protein
MMPPPDVMGDPRLDFSRRVNPEDRDTDVLLIAFVGLLMFSGFMRARHARGCWTSR